MTNTWPGGDKHSMDQDGHRAWNASHYPGTRQLCEMCDEPTERCEDDSIYVGDVGPLCEECGDKKRKVYGGLENGEPCRFCDETHADICDQCMTLICDGCAVYDQDRGKICPRCQ